MPEPLSLFIEAGWVIRLVYLVLLGLSLGSWSIMITKVLELNREERRSRRALERLARAKGLGDDLEADLEALLADPDSAARRMVLEGRDELLRSAAVHGAEPGAGPEFLLHNLGRALEREAQAQAERLASGLPFLATCAAAGPLLGLFGTVWGIMHSFHAFQGLTSQPLAAVAPGLAEALATTVLGLMVAIPAVLAHNYLRTRLGRVTGRLSRLEAEFQNRVKARYAAARRSG